MEVCEWRRRDTKNMFVVFFSCVFWFCACLFVVLCASLGRGEGEGVDNQDAFFVCV